MVLEGSRSVVAELCRAAGEEAGGVPVHAVRARLENGRTARAVGDRSDLLDERRRHARAGFCTGSNASIPFKEDS